MQHDVILLVNALLSVRAVCDLSSFDLCAVCFESWDPLSVAEPSLLLPASNMRQLFRWSDTRSSLL